MYHNNRRWCVQKVGSADELADKLLGYDWCGCCGFELEDCLWLNDSTAPDAVQEYAVVRKPTEESLDYLQVESITVGWCNRQELLEIIEGIQQSGPQPETGSGPVVVTRSVADLYQSLGALGKPLGWVVHPQIESPLEHDCCSHCA